MKWQGRRQSKNIVDRRRGGATGAVGGVGVVVVLLIGWALGVDVTPLLSELEGQGGTAQVSAADERAAEFVAVTLADTEEIWADILPDQTGQRYVEPALVLFSGATQSACGGASAATGPFYCPADKQIYLDTDFFQTMDRRLGASGDFAAAYVVAHEVAHSVQDQLGILGEANRVRAQVSDAQSNAISVRIELQADCYSGIWARAAAQTLGTVERGDLGEALNAARQIGDDTLQRNAGQRVQPHTFTHGTSDQRERWFEKGYESGDMRQCDTFSVQRL